MEATIPRKLETRTAHIERETLTLEEAAARLGIARSSAYDQARKNTFPVPIIKAGRRLFVSRVLVDRVIDPTLDPRHGQAA